MYGRMDKWMDGQTDRRTQKMLSLAPKQNLSVIEGFECLAFQVVYN